MYIRMGNTSSYNTQLRLGLNVIILIYRRVKYYKIYIYHNVQQTTTTHARNAPLADTAVDTCLLHA